MPDWFTMAGLIDAILLGMMVEALWLFWRHRKAGLHGPPPLLLHLVSGALLLIAMKQALSNMPDLFVATNRSGMLDSACFMAMSNRAPDTRWSSSGGGP